MTSAKDAVARLWGNDPWPDAFVEAMALPGPDFEPEPELAIELAWQVVARVRAGHPVPPRLQEWFNRYTVGGGHVPKRRPHRKGYDNAGLHLLKELYDVNKAEAVRLIAAASGRTPNAVETNLHRQTYKKK